MGSYGKFTPYLRGIGDICALAIVSIETPIVEGALNAVALHLGLSCGQISALEAIV